MISEYGHRVSSVRVFGSVVHGDDTEVSDLDLLVDSLPGIAHGYFKVDLEFNRLRRSRRCEFIRTYNEGNCRF